MKKIIIFFNVLFVTMLLAFVSCSDADTKAQSTNQQPGKQTPDDFAKIKAENIKLKEDIAKLNKDKDKTIKSLERENSFLIYLSVFASLIAATIYAMYFMERNRRLRISSSIKIEGSSSPNNVTRDKFEKSKSILPEKTRWFGPKPTTNIRWLVTGASVIGKSHIQSNIPCQDSHFITDLGGNWGIAISCDGAGSANKSHIGSKFVAERASAIFKHLVETQQWIKSGVLPNEVMWRTLSTQALQVVRRDLDEYAKKKELLVNDLACTIIVLIFSPLGLMVCHIGDGRAGYRKQSGEWQSLITPWKGDEANQTIFITSAIWNTPEKFLESRVVNETPTAFTLMSDGCESHSFELGYFDQQQQQFIEKNNPYPKFFDPLVEQIKKMDESGLSPSEIHKNWGEFLMNGSQGLSNEPDDKTMILGILLN